MKKVEIPSKLDSLHEIEKLVDELSETIAFNGEVYANILVGVTEAVNNAIVHGNKQDASKLVCVQFEATDRFVSFTVTDQGLGFNHYAVPDPTVPENIENEEGRGIFLMNNLADEVIYNDKGNEVSLKFFIG